MKTYNKNQHSHYNQFIFASALLSIMISYYETIRLKAEMQNSANPQQYINNNKQLCELNKKIDTKIDEAVLRLKMNKEAIKLFIKNHYLESSDLDIMDNRNGLYYEIEKIVNLYLDFWDKKINHKMLTKELKKFILNKLFDPQNIKKILYYALSITIGYHQTDPNYDDQLNTYFDIKEFISAKDAKEIFNLNI